MARPSQKIGSKEQKTPHNIAEPLTPRVEVSPAYMAMVHTVRAPFCRSCGPLGLALGLLATGCKSYKGGMHDNIPKGARDAAGSRTRVK
jgi:hypothetical protein